MVGQLVDFLSSTFMWLSHLPSAAREVAWYNILFCSAQICNALYYTVLCCTVLDCSELYCSVLYCTALHCTVVHWTVLPHSILKYVTSTVCLSDNWLPAFVLILSIDYFIFIGIQAAHFTCCSRVSAGILQVRTAKHRTGSRELLWALLNRIYYERDSDVRRVLR